MFQHSKRTFLLGFATTVKSVIEISKQLFVTVPLFKFLCKYNFSQDFLELFFGSIRMRFGCNNNPTCLEFIYALRRHLAKNYIQAGEHGNCTSLNENIGSVYCLKRKTKTVITVDCENELSKMNDEETKTIQNKVSYLLDNDDIKQNILNYICGFIIRKIIPSINCSSCLESLADDIKQVGNHPY